jgi:hypothetical protein
VTERTESRSRRIAENLAMGGLIAASRGVRLADVKIQRLVGWSERVGSALRWASPLPEHHDTLARGRALAYRWSKFVPGANCVDRAVATRVWLAGFRIDSRIVLGFRRRNGLEGHAWLEVELTDAVTLLFVGDDDGYEVALTG